MSFLLNHNGRFLMIGGAVPPPPPPPPPTGGPLCITMLNYAQIEMYVDEFIDGEPFSIDYKINDGEWTHKEFSTTESVYFDLNTGDKLYVKGNNATMNSNAHGRLRFGGWELDEEIGRPQVNLSGDITSLLNGVGGVLDLGSYGDRCFRNLFDNSNNAHGYMYIVHAKDLLLPSTTLYDYCYSNMFRRQDYMIDSPDLPSTTLAPSCYNYMFNGCYALAEIKIYYSGYFSDAPSSAFNTWVNNIRVEDGTFYYNGEERATGPSYIPYGWTVEPF